MNKYQIRYKGDKGVDGIAYMLKAYYKGFLVGNVRYNLDDAKIETLLFQVKKDEDNDKDRRFEGLMICLQESHRVTTIDIASIGDDEVSRSGGKAYVIYDKIKLDIMEEFEKIGFKQVETIEFTDDRD